MADMPVDQTQDRPAFVLPPDKLTALLRGMPLDNPFLKAPGPTSAPVAPGASAPMVAPPAAAPPAGAAPDPMAVAGSAPTSPLPMSVSPAGTMAAVMKSAPAPTRSSRYEQAAQTMAEPAPKYENYKPSILRRILGSLATGAMAYGHNPNAVELGTEAINAPYLTAQRAWAQRHQQAKDVTSTEENAYKDTNANWRSIVEQGHKQDVLNERYENLDRLKEKDKELGGYHSALADTRQQLADLKAQAQNNGVPKTDTERIEREGKRRYPLNAQKQYEFVQGELVKLKQAERPPRAEKNRSQYEDAYDAFVRENNRPPNADEIAKLGKGERAGKDSVPTFKDSAAIDKYSNQEYSKKRRDVLAEKAKAKSLNPDQSALQDEYQRIENDYKDWQKGFEADKRNWYTQVGSRGGAKNAPSNSAPAAATPAAAAKPEPASGNFPLKESGGHKVGEVVKLRSGQTVRITGFNKQGQFSHEPAGE